MLTAALLLFSLAFLLLSLLCAATLFAALRPLRAAPRDADDIAAASAAAIAFLLCAGVTLASLHFTLS